MLLTVGFGESPLCGADGLDPNCTGAFGLPARFTGGGPTDCRPVRFSSSIAEFRSLTSCVAEDVSAETTLPVAAAFVALRSGSRKAPDLLGDPVTDRAGDVDFRRGDWDGDKAGIRGLNIFGGDRGEFTVTFGGDRARSGVRLTIDAGLCFEGL